MLTILIVGARCPRAGIGAARDDLGPIDVLAHFPAHAPDNGRLSPSTRSTSLPGRCSRSWPADGVASGHDP
jgi:hypothetical protein